MKLTQPLIKLESKTSSVYELERYFDVGSLEELIVALRKYSRDQYFEYEIILSPEYIAREDSRRTVLLRSDRLNPVDPFGVMQRDSNHLDALYPKIREGLALSEMEIIKVIENLPIDLARDYLQFRLKNIDTEKIRKSLLSETPTDKKEDIEVLRYKGLTLTGANVEYLSTPIEIRAQLREILRVFLKNPNTLLTYDDFTDVLTDIFDPNKPSSNQRENLSKYISRLHTTLRSADAVGKRCIFNEHKEGWLLRID